ncbi:hypothetical protein BOTBODRAFT_181643 [Botryobasidium botryosum FD-172 SS1]|uniref:G protein-coupled receptor n=1 Tax=Botryobasidium botryosum (strain FD-172 SS1) TaxID=930990 RepID=A0A067LVW6_BOTB1|nr:hypothetical protein BOTBODRAFT_181643 [Botryobasidium botryosum FD-172 SS1]
MANDLDFADNRTVLIALVIEVFLYGIYIPLLFVCLWIMISREDAPNWKLIAPLIAMSMISTTHVAVSLYLFIQHFLNLDQQSPATVVAFGLYDALNLIGDGIVIYRCYVICDSRLRVVTLPVMFLLAGTSGGICSTVSFGFGYNSFSALTERLGLASRSLSLVLNATCTGLITHRIWSRTRMVFPIIGPRRAAKCYAVLMIAVESAALYTVAMAVLIGVYAGRALNVAQVPFQVNIQIVCIVPTLMPCRYLTGPRTVHRPYLRKTIMDVEQACSAQVPSLLCDTSSEVDHGVVALRAHQ